MKKIALVIFSMLSIVLVAQQIDIIQWLDKNNIVQLKSPPHEAEKEEGKLYKWVDKNGVFHFTSSPPKGNKNVEVIQTKDYQVESLELAANATPSAANLPIKKNSGRKDQVAQKTTKNKLGTRINQGQTTFFVSNPEVVKDQNTPPLSCRLR